MKQRYINCIKLLKNNKKNGKILDLGCGDGALTYMLFKEGYNSEGIDLSAEGINLAINMHKKKKTNCNFHHGDISNLSSNSYDGLICSDVIEHVDDPAKLIEESLRVVKKGGCVIFSTPIKITENPLDKEHIIEWFPNEWKSLFNKYENVSFEQSHPVALMELMNWGKIKLILIVISLLTNIFLVRSRFRYFALQYAILTK